MVELVDQWRVETLIRQSGQRVGSPYCHLATLSGAFWGLNFPSFSLQLGLALL